MTENGSSNNDPRPVDQTPVPQPPPPPPEPPQGHLITEGYIPPIEKREK